MRRTGSPTTAGAHHRAVGRGHRRERRGGEHGRRHRRHADRAFRGQRGEGHVGPLADARRDTGGVAGGVRKSPARAGAAVGRTTRGGTMKKMAIRGEAVRGAGALRRATSSAAGEGRDGGPEVLGGDVALPARRRRGVRGHAAREGVRGAGGRGHRQDRGRRSVAESQRHALHRSERRPLDRQPEQHALPPCWWSSTTPTRAEAAWRSPNPRRYRSTRSATSST